MKPYKSYFKEITPFKVDKKSIKGKFKGVKKIDFVLRDSRNYHSEVFKNLEKISNSNNMKISDLFNYVFEIGKDEYVFFFIDGTDLVEENFHIYYVSLREINVKNIIKKLENILVNKFSSFLKYMQGGKYISKEILFKNTRGDYETVINLKNPKGVLSRIFWILKKILEKNVLYYIEGTKKGSSNTRNKLYTLILKNTIVSEDQIFSHSDFILFELPKSDKFKGDTHWIYNNDISDLRFTIDNSNVIIVSSGKLQFSNWEDGIWEGGLFKNSKWNNGIFRKGIFQNGTWEKGIWLGGTWDVGWIYDPDRLGNNDYILKEKGEYVFTKVSPKEYFGQEKSPYN